MKTVIDAALVGDSHASIMIKSGEDAGLQFKCPIAAAAPNFVGAGFVTDENGDVRFKISEFRKDEAFFGTEKTERFARKAAKLDVMFRDAFKRKLPVYANVGMTAVHFVNDLMVAAEANGQDGTLLSAKIARATAEDYIVDYIRFYETLVRQAPSVTCVFGPTRFRPESRHIWIAYDEVICTRLSQIGVRILDLRHHFGNEQLLLDPRYYKDSGDDFVHANAKWGLEMVQEIQDDLSRRTSLPKTHDEFTF